MTSTNHSKGGDNRVVISGAVDSDSFVLPAGNILESLTVKELDDTGGNISFGSDAKFETSTLEFTYAPDSPGDIRITLGGSNNDFAVDLKTVTVPITSGVTGAGIIISVTVRAGIAATEITVSDADDTAGKVATAIAEGDYPAHITAEVTDATNVTFTYDGGYWTAGAFNVDVGTTGITLGPIGEAGQGDLAELAAYISDQDFTGYTVVDDGISTVTFTKTAFGNITDLAFTDKDSTGTAATAATSVQGATGVGVVLATVLSGASDTITELSPVVAGQVQSMTEDATIYVNIDTGASVDVYATIQQLN